MVSMFSVNDDMIVVGGKSSRSFKLGITLPKSTVERIDKVRGDIPRSRYILRAIESYLVADSSKEEEEGEEIYNTIIRVIDDDCTTFRKFQYIEFFEAVTLASHTLNPRVRQNLGGDGKELEEEDNMMVLDKTNKGL